MAIDTTDVVNPGTAINAITPIVLTIDPARGEDGSPGEAGLSVTWRGNWQTGVTYNVNDAVARNGASYIAIVQNTSVDPATDNGSIWGLMSAQGAEGPTGPPGVNYKGAWVSTTNYVINDLVTKLGNSYIAVSSSTNIDPSTDNGTHWQLFAAAGSGGDMYRSQYDVNDNGLVDHSELADTAPWAGITGKPAIVGDMQTSVYDPSKSGRVPPSAHAPTHLVGGSDPIPIATSSQTGLMRVLSGLTTDFVDGTNTCQALSPAVQPVIWSARQRTFNSVGNPNFEVDQVNVGNSVTCVNGAHIIDRWFANVGGTGVISGQQLTPTATPVILPGTNFLISNKMLRVVVQTGQPTLGATDQFGVYQLIEGPMLRELINDVHSVTLLVKSTIAVKFGLSLRDSTSTHSLVKLCTLTTPNVWTLIPLPNLPIFTSSGSFPLASGGVGYSIKIALAAGSSFVTPANDSWQNGNFFGAVGQDNYLANAGAIFDIAFVQHEPGPQCTTLIDCPFSGPNGNLEACQRYYQKSYYYGTAVGTVNTGYLSSLVSASTTLVAPGATFKRTMAKNPSVTIYDASTGAASSVLNASTGTHVAVSNAGNVTDSQFSHIALAAAQTSGQLIQYAYTADTGW
jgi:hypothetical protein